MVSVHASNLAPGAPTSTAFTVMPGAHGAPSSRWPRGGVRSGAVTAGGGGETGVRGRGVDGTESLPCRTAPPSLSLSRPKFRVRRIGRDFSHSYHSVSVGHHTVKYFYCVQTPDVPEARTLD